MKRYAVLQMRWERLESSLRENGRYRERMTDYKE